VQTHVLSRASDHRWLPVDARAAVGLTAAVVFSLALIGCRSDAPGTPTPQSPSARPSNSSARCDYGESDQERAGGPLQRQSNSMTYRMNYLPPGRVQDATVIPLVNSGSSPVLIDSVDLVPDPAASSLRLIAAYVASPGVTQRIGAPRTGHEHVAAKGHCLPPLGTQDRAPILALRIAPASPGSAGEHRFSRNNSVNIHYRTDTGQRFVAVYPVRFEYPNHPE
jgi:hypothetical protein